MNIAILGYGKMGKIIEKICLQRQHNVIITIDKDNIKDLTPNILSSIDVAIEFTQPESAIENYLLCFRNNIPVVSGTTGWLDNWEQVISECKKYDGSFFYASNFSIGVNVLFSMNKKLANIMQQFDDYKCHIEETHHIHKLDAPSGTAISIANDIIKANKKLVSWKLEKDAQNQDLPIKSIREGEITGKHTIIYESNVDMIKLEHEAKNRQGFALGAVLAAEFIYNKKGIYNMQDMLAL